MSKIFTRVLFLLFALVVTILIAQASIFSATVGKISGHIVDTETGESLAGVNVIIPGTDLGAATDEDGDYFIVNVPPGTYSVTASMIGYEKITKTEVEIYSGRTTNLDFELNSSAIEGATVTVTAEREIVPMDISSSRISASQEQIASVPNVSDLQGYMNLQPGIEGGSIRGGSLDETQFMVDGLMVVDNKSNTPMMMVNLTAVQEVDIMTGGFNAEYGNIRSGLINVVTKEGSFNRYHGSADFRYSPVHQKHRGVSLYDRNNFYLRPYLDPAVCWVGTQNGSWDEATQEQYYPFIGWDAVAENIEGMTPAERRKLFIWRTLADGADTLGQRIKKYGNKPDWNVDATFSGPLFESKYLGQLSFLASYRNNWDAFALPVSRDYYKDETSLLKLTSRISPSLKLRVDGIYQKINSVSQSGGGMDNYLTSGTDIFNHISDRKLYWPSARLPFNVYRSMQGITLDNSLNSKTFYNVRLTHVQQKNFADGPAPVGSGAPVTWRDTTRIRQFGNHWVDEEPWNFWYLSGRLETINDQDYSGEGATTRDYSSVNTLNLKFDITSQANKYNQVKAGFEVNYDDLNIHYADSVLYSPNNGWAIKWQQQPYRAGAYVQDKLEFEGMIANFGLRLDYNDPNTDWFTVDRYSKYFNIKDKSQFVEATPKEPAKGQLKISPRLGISHPISAKAKLYFNYGHFYSMPTSDAMYRIQYRPGTQLGVSSIGNPNADLPKTIAYELGLDYDINGILLHAAGYYKDVTDQTGWISYISRDHSVDYNTIDNSNYEDIRGFEVRLEKRWGRWISGWMNYDYMVQTSGYVGRQVYYQDEMEAMLYGLYNPYVEKPLARPRFQANILFNTPENFGPTLGAIKPLGEIQISLLASWKSGRYVTWDPLETYELQQNLQWKGKYNIDARFSKLLHLKGSRVRVYVDVKNLFDIKYMSSLGFVDGEDAKRYYESLHLPMYEGERYQEAGFVAGNDKPGDVKSDKQPYINMPNRKFLTYLNPRSIFFGFRLEF